jgi:hypothetical protein
MIDVAGKELGGGRVPLHNRGAEVHDDVRPGLLVVWGVHEREKKREKERERVSILSWVETGHTQISIMHTNRQSQHLERLIELVPKLQLVGDEGALGRLGRGRGRDDVALVDELEILRDEGVGPREVQAVHVRA